MSVRSNETTPDVIAKICGTTENTVGKVVTSVATTHCYESYENNDDERTTEQHDERASSSATTEHSWIGSQ